uniref:Uncharacterized protein n=1 Tax=Rhodopseudomonas palustris (strain BisA53) TaxID=316055 RepID=Q07NX4_RHOP5
MRACSMGEAPTGAMAVGLIGPAAAAVLSRAAVAMESRRVLIMVSPEMGAIGGIAEVREQRSWWESSARVAACEDPIAACCKGSLMSRNCRRGFARRHDQL